MPVIFTEHGLNHVSSPKLVLCVATTIGFILPFEFILAMFASALGRPLLGDLYYLLFPASWGCVLLLLTLLVRKESIRVSITVAIFIMIYLFIGTLDYTATIFNKHMIDLAKRQLILGFIFPSLLLIWLLTSCEPVVQRFFRCFLVGWIILLGGAFIVLFATYPVIDEISKLGIAGFIISYRYVSLNPEVTNYYALLIGNANKTSNYLVLLLLIFSVVYTPRSPRLDKFLVTLFVFLAIATLLLLFSRAALMLLPIVLFISGIHKTVPLLRKFYLVVLALIVIFCIFYFDEISIVSNYLLFSKYMDGPSSGALGTFNNRFDQWADVKQLLADSDVLLYGMGVGGYGNSLGDPQAGTHNLFLDHLLSSGICSFISLLTLICIGLFNSIKIKSFVCFSAFIVFLMLAVREHSFSYLFSSSMGGVVFILCAYILYRGQYSQVRCKYFNFK